MNDRAFSDIGRLILRLTTSGLILFHGISKLIHGVSWMSEPLAALHLPAFLAYGVYLGEVAAPLFIIAGVWTRPAALFVVVNMIMAILLEAWRLFPRIQPTGAWGMEAEAFYLLTAIAIFFLGTGRYGLMGDRRGR